MINPRRFDLLAEVQALLPDEAIVSTSSNGPTQVIELDFQYKGKKTVVDVSTQFVENENNDLADLARLMVKKALPDLGLQNN